MAGLKECLPLEPAPGGPTVPGGTLALLAGGACGKMGKGHGVTVLLVGVELF